MNDKEKKEKIDAISRLIVRLNKHNNDEFFNKDEVDLLRDGLTESIASIIMDGNE